MPKGKKSNVSTNRPSVRLSNGPPLVSTASIQAILPISHSIRRSKDQSHVVVAETERVIKLNANGE